MMFSLFLGVGLPKDNDAEALRASDYWRFVVGFPMILQVLSVLSMVAYVKYDSIRFLVSTGRYNHARDMIRLVYQCNKERPNKIITQIEQSSNKGTSSVTITEALTSPHHRRATWIALAIIIFHELTGENAIMLYSTEIFRKMIGNQDGSVIEPRVATVVIGVFNFLAHFPAIYVVKKLPRRYILISGHLLTALCHIFIGAFAASSNNGGVIVMVAIFMVVYVIANGPIVWLYVSEIVVDTALGVCLFTLWSAILMLSLFTGPLMDSFLRPEGVFWILGISQLGGAWFSFRNVKETQGLNDLEKKELYSYGVP